MQATRRRVMATMAGAVAGLASESIWAQVRTATPQPLPSPNAPQNENVPAGLDGANIPVVNGRNVVPPATWMDIRKQARELLSMTLDFKEKVDTTNLGSTLPLDLLKQARRIEKQIKKIERQMKS